MMKAIGVAPVCPHMSALMKRSCASPCGPPCAPPAGARAYENVFGSVSVGTPAAGVGLQPPTASEPAGHQAVDFGAEARASEA